jgi:TolB-like protein
METGVDEIRGAVSKILGSARFSRSKRARQLLGYLVEETLAGRGDGLKAFSIALDVFGKDTSFDAVADPLVRVQIGRLRALLAEYYGDEGAVDCVKISLERGDYQPRFIRETAPAAARAAPWPRIAPLGAAVALILAVVGWLVVVAPPPPTDSEADHTIYLAPLDAPPGDAQGKRFGEALASLLLADFAQMKTLSMVAPPGRDGAGDAKAAATARFAVETRLVPDDGRLRLALNLRDRRASKIVWGKTYDEDADAAGERLVALADRIASDLHLALHRAINDGETPPLDGAGVKTLYLAAVWTPGRARNSLKWEKQRVELAARALAIDPEYGPAHSVLADKLSYLANVDPPSDTAEQRAEAERHADRAIDLSPDDADAVFNVSIHYWHAGDLARSERFTRRTLELNPHHPIARFLADVVPFTCAPAPPAVIERLIAFDRALFADSPERWVTLTWVALLYLNNGDAARSLEYSRRADAVFRTPDTVYRYAVALVKTSDAAGAKALLRGQRENWPNLDPRHYAETVIPRRCRGAPLEGFLRDAYGEMAAAVGPPGP